MTTKNPARQKQASEHPNFKKPGMVETVRLRSQGKRDGHRGLPRQDENGVWTSPQLYKEITDYHEFCIAAWGGLQAKHEAKHKEITRLCQEIHRLGEQLCKHLNNAPPVNLTERIRGEENLSESIVRNRRQREHNKRHNDYYSRQQQLEAALEEHYCQLAELQSVIQAAEKTVRMQCKRSQGRAIQRITVYWNAALRAHPQFKTIPPTPEITLESDSAEAEYFAHNQPLWDEVKKVLVLRQRMANDGMTVNMNRTEGCYAKQKSNRR